jgi:hypothetical protein
MFLSRFNEVFQFQILNFTNKNKYDLIFRVLMNSILVRFKSCGTAKSVVLETGRLLNGLRQVCVHRLSNITDCTVSAP